MKPILSLILSLSLLGLAKHPAIASSLSEREGGAFATHLLPLDPLAVHPLLAQSPRPTPLTPEQKQTIVWFMAGGILLGGAEWWILERRSRQQRSRLERQVADLGQLLDQTQTALNKLEKQQTQQIQASEQKEQEKTRQILILQAERDRLRQDIQTLSSDLAAAQRVQQQLEQTLAAQTADLEPWLTLQAELSQTGIPDVRDVIQRNQVEIDFLTQYVQEVEDEIQGLVEETRQLKRDLTDRENSLVQLQFSTHALATPDPAFAPPEAESQPHEQNLDLSHLCFALVGGHQATHNGVTQRLSTENHVKNIVVIPSSQEKSINQTQLQSRLRGCDVIVVITGYMGHDLSTMITNLQKSGSLEGQVLLLPMNCKGVSGVLREIRQFVTTKIDPSTHQESP